MLPVNEALNINFHEKEQMNDVVGRTSIDSIAQHNHNVTNISSNGDAVLSA